MSGDQKIPTDMLASGSPHPADEGGVVEKIPDPERGSFD